MKKTIAKILTMTSLSIFAATAYAADGTSTFPKASAEAATREEMKPHVGIIGGVATPEGRYDSAAEYGIDVGFQPLVPFGFGAEVSRYEADARETADADLERTTVLLKGSYNFGGTIPVIKESYVGVGVGPIFKQDATGAVLAPMVGFDIPIQRDRTQYLSLGANAKYMFLDGSDPDSLSVNGALKYWF